MYVSVSLEQRLETIEWNMKAGKAYTEIHEFATGW